MGIPHHPRDEELQRRFLDEIEKKARREWPDGRIGPDDDGMTAFAFAHDRERHVLRIAFTKPMDWIAFDVESAKKLYFELGNFLSVEKPAAAQKEDGDG